MAWPSPPEALHDISANREARIDYVEKDGTKVATQIAFKGPIKIAPEKLVKYAEVEQLVALGPEQGSYTLIDSRPLPRVQEGTIPTAINLPYPCVGQVRGPAAEGQEPPHRVLLRGRHLHDEPEFAAEGGGPGLHER